MLISICIPCYEMAGKGGDFLNFSLAKIYNQTYKNIEVVISDHSVNTVVKSIAEKWSRMFRLKYIHKTFKIDNPSSNLNNAILNSSGYYIKILFQDDFLYNIYAIENTVNFITNNRNINWIVSACEHSNDGFVFYRPFTPAWNEEMWKGINTISSPSVLTIKNNNNKILFDENLKWLMDCDYYQNCYNEYGLPGIIDDITIVNRTWENQLSNLLTRESKNHDYIYLKLKYGK